MENNETVAWRRYEDGRLYNNRLVPNQYRLVDTNIEFFAGNQWLHLAQTPAMSRLPKPVFNVLKRVAQLFVASLTSSGTTIHFEPLSYYDGENLDDPQSNAAEFASAEVANLLEKFKFEYRLREALFDGAQTGDYCAHFWWDPDALPYGGAFGPYRGEIRMELVDGINIMFGNPNDDCVENQPYILVIGRDTVENLRTEAERYRKNKKLYGKGGKSDPLPNASDIQPDSEWEWQAAEGGKIEITPDDDTGKALYLYMYTKVSKDETVTDPKTGEPMLEPEYDENGDPVYERDKKGELILGADNQPIQKQHEMKHLVTSVHVTKACRNAIIFEDVDTGMTRYPVAWANWERQKNQYHGRALVTGLIPNQIFINSMFAMVMRHMQLESFPKTVYNADLIAQWNNEIGSAIGIKGLQPGQNINSVAYNMQVADMSNQILTVIDKAISYTKDCLGATDAQLGNVRPDNTSALMVLQSNAEVPLENIRAGLHEWVEDIGAILLDMMGTYYGERPIVRDRTFQEPMKDPMTGEPMIDPMTGQMQMQTVTRRVTEPFDFSQFKHLWLNVRADVGATSQFSEIAMTQTLDNLRANGVIDVIQYLERVPDKLIPKKAELIDELKKAATEQQAAPTEEQPQAAPQRSAPGANLPTQGGQLTTDKVVNSLPASIQSKYAELPRGTRNALGRMATMRGL
ncbi:MAG: hypothetical protein II008_03865 [Oscillospiraceae bacterium]|nr:hypothetical protein [Oscillospiraceae bacterium]